MDKTGSDMGNIDRELEKLELKKDRKAYTKAVEDALKEEITPMLWKMTRYEGKILLKLIDRETNITVFGIIKELRSGFTAGFYQALARLFGNNLKLEYDPEGEDAVLEQMWKNCETHDAKWTKRFRSMGVLNLGRIPGKAGYAVVAACYKGANKIVRFN